MKLAVLIIAVGCLGWIFVDQLENGDHYALPQEDQIQASQELPVPDSSPPENPPLPEVTRRKIETIRHILTSEELDYRNLFSRHSSEENLKILVLERWIESDHRSALDAVAGTELASLA